MKGRTQTLDNAGFTKAPCEEWEASSDQQGGKGETQGYWAHEKESKAFSKQPLIGISQRPSELSMGDVEKPFVKMIGLRKGKLEE